MLPFDNDLLWIRKLITTCDKFSEGIYLDDHKNSSDD